MGPHRRQFEHALPYGTLVDFVLCDRQGRPMAALEAKRALIDTITVGTKAVTTPNTRRAVRLLVERRGGAVS